MCTTWIFLINPFLEGWQPEFYLHTKAKQGKNVLKAISFDKLLSVGTQVKNINHFKVSEMIKHVAEGRYRFPILVITGKMMTSCIMEAKSYGSSQDFQTSPTQRHLASNTTETRQAKSARITMLYTHHFYHNRNTVRNKFTERSQKNLVHPLLEI
jgi:hypothetical protein